MAYDGPCDAFPDGKRRDICGCWDHCAYNDNEDDAPLGWYAVGEPVHDYEGFGPINIIAKPLI